MHQMLEKYAHLSPELENGYGYLVCCDKRRLIAMVEPASWPDHWHVSVIEHGGILNHTKRPVHADWVGITLYELGLLSLTASWRKTTAEPTEQHPMVREQTPRERRGYIYFIQPIAGGLIKIGYSENPESRLQSIQTMSPLPLRIIGLIGDCQVADESELHSRFRHLRQHGEWFFDAEELLDYVKQNAKLVKS